MQFKLNDDTARVLRDADAMLQQHGLPGCITMLGVLAQAGMVLDGRSRDKETALRAIRKVLEPMMPGNGRAELVESKESKQ